MRRQEARDRQRDGDRENCERKGERNRKEEVKLLSLSALDIILNSTINNNL